MSCVTTMGRISLRDLRHLVKNEFVVLRHFGSGRRTVKGPISVFEERIKSGVLKPDSHQVQVTNALQSLYENAKTYVPAKPVSQSGLFSWPWQTKPTSHIGSSLMKGLYIHGSVGGGKTTLMDMFYDCCDTVRRVLEATTWDTVANPKNFRLSKSNEFTSIRLWRMFMLAFTMSKKRKV